MDQMLLMLKKDNWSAKLIKLKYKHTAGLLKTTLLAGKETKVITFSQ